MQITNVHSKAIMDPAELLWSCFDTAIDEPMDVMSKVRLGTSPLNPLVRSGARDERGCGSCGGSRINGGH